MLLSKKAMAHKTVRRKFRPPLKEGASLPCSQTSSTLGLFEVSQERGLGKDGSQSWLSQLTVTDESVPLFKEPASANSSTNNVANELEASRHEAIGAKDSIFSLDDSISLENENFNIGGDIQDSLSSNARKVMSPLHQVTRTHTVLSFCSETSSTPAESELQKRTMGNFQIVEYAADPTDLDNTVVDSEDAAVMKKDTTGNSKETMSRFQHKNKSSRRYDYSKILPRFGPQQARNGGNKNINTKSRTKKSVTLVVNQDRFSKTSTSAVCGAGHQDSTAKGDLSVYEYQPTPEQQQQREGGRGEEGEREEMNNSNWISKRTREEQLAVDREVLKTISKVREEIRIIRKNYAARKAGKKTSLQSTAGSSKAHTFKTPQQELKRLRRAKPPLVISEDYGSSVLHKEPYGMACHKYTALQKEE